MGAEVKGVFSSWNDRSASEDHLKRTALRGHGSERGGDGAEVADKAAVEIGKP